MITVEENQAIEVFTLRYIQLPDKRREWIRHKAQYIVEFKGSTPASVEFNRILLSRLNEVEACLNIVKKEDHPPERPIHQPTFLEVAMLFRPIFHGAVIILGIGWFAIAAWNFIKGTAAQVQIFGREYGGYLALSAFGVLLLSMLPKPKFGGDENGKTTTEKFEQETFWQKTTYEKTTEK